MQYIEILEAISKIKAAEEHLRPVAILAHAGWGKTALADHCFRRKRVLTLSGDRGCLDRMPEINRIRQGIVVIDGVTWIDDPESEEYIRELLRDGSRQIVLLGRGRFPVWLEPVAREISFVHITHRDLRLTEDHIRQLFLQEGITLSGAEVSLLLEMTDGYPPALSLCLRRALRGESIDRVGIALIKTELFHFFQEVFFQRIKPEAREFLLEVCDPEFFTSGIAEAVAGEGNARVLIEYCETVGSFLERTAPDTWTIIEYVREFLQWKRSLLWSAKRRQENNRRLAAWYEKEGRLVEAAGYYEKLGDTKRILDLLVRNSRKHPGISQYHALRHHYEKLPEDMILKEPALITGICYLKSMTMRPEESEQWYRELEQFENNETTAPEKKKAARAYRCYLDIGLPHRAGAGMIRIMKSTLRLMHEHGFELPEFSVTDNIPSLLDGGLDYSEWTRSAGRILGFMEGVLERLLGRHGKGLTDVGLAEAGFECGNMEPSEVIRVASKGIAKATGAGSPEICFAGYGVLIRQHLAQGNIKTARACLEAFRHRVEREEETQLLPNIKATDALIALYESDHERVSHWLAETPDVHREFSIMDRYIYRIKLQCLIALGCLSEAMNLATYLDWYYSQYRRTLAKIENDILSAIISYRQGSYEWNGILAGALQSAEQYNYVQVGGMKGSALLPLLTSLETDLVSRKFLNEVRSCCRKMTLKYPDFMKHDSREIPRLTAREQEVLGLLCSGESMEEICRICGISYSGLKKHNRNIYAKLGAKNRAEAERIAVSRRLIRSELT